MKYINSTVINCSYCGEMTPCSRKKCIHCGLDIRPLNPELCCFAWYRFIHRKKLEALRKRAYNEWLNSTMGGNSIERSEWYCVMSPYIDKLTDKTIASRHCYKFGREDVDKSSITKGQLGYCQAFWVIKASIIRKKYGLTWHSPQEMNPDIHYD